MSAFVYGLLLISPLMLMLVGVQVAPHSASDASWWISIGLAAFCIYSVITTIFLERQFACGAAAAKLRAKGRNPDRDIALVGVVMLLAPGSAAFLASFLGLSFVQLIGYAAFSFGGVAFWGWRHRRSIGPAA